MTLAELVERLTSHPVYQAGRAGEVEVHVNTGLFPLTTRRVRGLAWIGHGDKEYIVLDVTGHQRGPMTDADFVLLAGGGGGAFKDGA